MIDVIKKTGPLAIIGPSGCGKTSVLTVLSGRQLLHVTPTWTDRPRRGPESELEHQFVSPEAFDSEQRRGGFLAVVQPFGLAFRYGLPPIERLAGQAAVVMIRAPFVEAFRKLHPDATVYQIEAEFAFASAGVIARGGQHGTRLTDFEAEIAAGRELSDRIFRNVDVTLEELADQVESAIRRDGLIYR